MVPQTYHRWRLNFTFCYSHRNLPLIGMQDIRLSKKHQNNRTPQIADVQWFIIAVEYEHLSVHLHKRTFSFGFSKKSPLIRRTVCHTQVQRRSGLLLTSSIARWRTFRQYTSTRCCRGQRSRRSWCRACQCKRLCSASPTRRLPIYS